MIVLLNAAACAFNAALFVGNHSPMSMAGAVFCGLVAICCAVTER